MSKFIPNTTPIDLQKLSTSLEANSLAVPPSGRKRSTISNKAREKWQLRGKGDPKRPAESTHGEEETKKALARRARARNVGTRGATDDSPFATNEKPFQYPAPNAPDYPMHSPSPCRITFADPGLQALPRLTAGATIPPAQYPDYSGVSPMFT
ncbi:hypothetical protein BDN70DRAFT_884460 [Pholiota conissans]|uniref:Uncharacterized protein n=1 Tax=Pholiota conissans TaxID=109636 RepID=A0A9P5YTD1_9AGAR|nr:hypothetical protein BDN70DRAFT_884460 [Pholiota conissans]